MYIIKVKGGGYRCQVERNGVRDSATRTTKGEAEAWGREREREILALARGGFPDKTLKDALERYRDTESVKKAGAVFETRRIDALIRDYPKLVAKPLVETSTKDWSEWRDARLKDVTRGSVERDIHIWSHVYTIARKEWKWCGASPITDMRRPGDNPPRKARPPMSDVRRLLRRLGYRTGEPPRTKSCQVAYAYLIGLRTAMRASEILSLDRANVDFARREALVHHKMEYVTGERRRVPLSKRGMRLIAIVLDAGGFTIDSDGRDALFRKAKAQLLIKTRGLTFHDSRADALTRFAKKVGVMELAKISGHTDLRVLQETYYRVSSAEIAARLD